MENYILANYTDTGKVRAVNEDAMATFDSPNGRVVVVCDGMGGQNAGDVASQLAVTVIQDILSDNMFPSPEEAITRSVMAANQAILRRAAQDDFLSGMGSTCVMVIIKDGQVYYGSVGDSRIYYIAGGSIRQITKDQSYVQTLVDEGRISKEAAEHHQDKNQITNALGIENMIPPVICQMPITPEPGSVFVLCTDGLSGMVNNNTILNTVINRNLSLNERAAQLVNLANAAGGEDNITVQLIEFPEGAATGAGAAYQGASRAAYVNPKPKSKHSSSMMAAICMLALAIVGGAAFWYFSNQKKEPKPQQNSVITPKPEKQPVTPRYENKNDKEIIIVKEEPRKPDSKANSKNKSTKAEKNSVSETKKKVENQNKPKNQNKPGLNVLTEQGKKPGGTKKEDNLRKGNKTDDKRDEGR